MILKFALFCLFATTAMANNVQKVSSANNNFANKLFKELSKKDGNVFFSPLSVHTALAMAYQGAGGKTAEQFQTGLTLEKSAASDGYFGVMKALNSVENITLHLANKIYVKEGFSLKPTFKEVLTQKFFSEVEPINFGDNEKAANTINQWCESKTNKKIKDLIKPDDLDPLTRLVLLNAIYFKGNWLEKFDVKNTRKDKFYVNEKETVEVDMMFIHKKFMHAYNRDLEAQVLELKYTNQDVSMVIILPNEKFGIKGLEEKLADYDLSKLTEGMHESIVDLHLPKFKVETTMELNDPLKNMGLDLMFSDAADFNEMLETPEQLKVSKVIQKAFIEVNEEGAEAAAATGMTIMAMSMPPQLHINQPFIFFIKARVDDNDNILFYGRISKPEY